MNVLFMGICICCKCVKTDVEIMNNKSGVGSLGREWMDRERPRMSTSGCVMFYI